ncbi:MAG: D-alanyl-D-alanine carboxypeptidase family protein [Acidimicrobiales bacterium]
MTDNMAAAMARISAIRTTIGAATPARTVAAATTAASPRFADLLAKEIDRTPGSTPTTSSSGAPPGLEGYSNGRIPVDALAPIPGGEFMWGPAAEAFTRMADDAARAGITLPVVDAYRPYEDQVRLANELGLYSQGGLAAVPGTSQHGWGRAIDITLDDEALAWMRTNAAAYGFHETVPREPWHWEFHP